MGCNLKDLVEPEAVQLSDFAGQRIGVDAYLVLYQFLASIRNLGADGDGGPLRDDEGRPVSHLMGLLARTTLLIEAGIEPVYVFDGRHHELKDHILEERRARRDEAETKHAAAVESGDIKAVQRAAQQMLDLTPAMVEEAQHLLTLLGVPWFTAAQEGEGAAAVLNARGDLHGVASQDWDTLLYGAPVMLRNLLAAGTRRMGRVVVPTKIDLAATLERLDITREQLVDIAIMTGTDFHPGIPRIGAKTGLKHIRAYGSLEGTAEAKGFDLPDRLAEIRQIFHDHPVGEVPSLEQGKASEADLKAWLIGERGFSEQRVATNLARLEGRMLRHGQRSLADWT